MACLVVAENPEATGIEWGASPSVLVGGDPAGELVSEPGDGIARRAEIGLVERGPIPWKVDKLP
jgi:hypothetical protein